MTGSLRALLTSLVDYAGLFPPASLSMEEAVRNYESYRSGKYAWMLGRFVVPSSRLHEVPKDFALSVLANGPDSLPDSDTIEVKAASAGEIEEIARIAGSRTVYIEITDFGLLDSIARHGLRAKMRTGGVTADAFPEAKTIADFIDSCARRGVAFKATAGLHHPIRCFRSLTYAADAPSGTMHGFLNVFLAAALRLSGVVADGDGLTAMLMDDDPKSFGFNDAEASWRGHSITSQQLAMSRQKAISFGSCSFEEPIADLQQLGYG